MHPNLPCEFGVWTWRRAGVPITGRLRARQIIGGSACLILVKQLSRLQHRSLPSRLCLHGLVVSSDSPMGEDYGQGRSTFHSGETPLGCIRVFSTLPLCCGCLCLGTNSGRHRCLSTPTNPRARGSNTIVQGGGSTRCWKIEKCQGTMSSL